jgi:hypothetical protein
MQEFIKLIWGILFLILGIPIGKFLAKFTEDEKKDGQKWFKLIIFLSLIGSCIGLIILNDILMFTFLFVAIVTIQSLEKNYFLSPKILRSIKNIFMKSR